ncbi:putative Ig domain-containing protein [Pyxidicoccus parkwayensis]|uniref:Ig domain-containing protein n=1 Tax=Pyxidicoccus parkwayensis TaxID=2813578 RepID=A0ABX7NS53_9BACT|nr:putative Ig domain-containing protein [Pyxidicoccus parkwaysis]QSQ21722.1 putative Ig domain-containing protein [Pyxidicoccus parkwaysis]
MRRVLHCALAVLCVVAACTFSPDLSRYAACDAQGGCEKGFTCLTAESLCIPECGDEVCDSGDPTPGADAGDAGEDAGTREDAGVDASVDAGTEVDAGTDAGVDAGTDAGTQQTDAGTALGLDPDALALGREGTAYSGRLRARGGTPPYSFTAPVGLPSGLNLDSEGNLTGTPAAPGDYFLSINVTDRSTPQQQASGSIPLRISPTLRMAGPEKLTASDQGKAYLERLCATGGKEPYHFKLADAGTLPSSLQLAENGDVTGTASQQTGTADFVVEVTDSDSPPQVTTRRLSMETVNLGGFTLDMLTRSLPDGRVGSTYSYTLHSFGGTPPFSWSWAWTGPAPAGLQLDKDQGLIYGKPSQAGTYTVTLTVSDSLIQAKSGTAMTLVVVP